MKKTVIKWHNVETDGLPEKSGAYLTKWDNGRISELDYSAEHRLFNVSGGNLSTAITVTYWAQMPKIGGRE